MGETYMNIIQVLFFVWGGIYGHLINLIKQHLFQNKDLKTQIKDIRWLASVAGVAVVAQGTWVLDGIVRQKLKISEMYGYTSLISAPISAITLILILKYSEQNLSDKVNWMGVAVWIMGMLLSMVGAQWMMNK